MTEIISVENIADKIFVIRGLKVMLDSDLAELYGVKTKQLKRAVRRNIDRFFYDFMFELNDNELEILRSQIGTSSWGGSRYQPMAFTEQGVYAFQRAEQQTSHTGKHSDHADLYPTSTDAGRA